MNTIKFKTNIKCGGCIAAVTPSLNDTVGAGNWQVDIQASDKVLTANLDAVTPAQVKQAIEKAGYKAELIG